MFSTRTKWKFVSSHFRLAPTLSLATAPPAQAVGHFLNHSGKRNKTLVVVMVTKTNTSLYQHVNH